jgi:hypothetical protein
MARSKQIPAPKLVWNAGTITTTSNSGAFDAPQADAYAWILETTGASGGTSPTLDVALQITPDGGTTWWSVAKWAQVTSSNVKQMKVHSNGPITGQAAAVSAIADTGSAVEANFPVTKSMRILATVGGSGGSGWASTKVWCIPIYNDGRLQ